MTQEKAENANKIVGDTGAYGILLDAQSCYPCGLDSASNTEKVIRTR